jgi:hypothetical protein
LSRVHQGPGHRGGHGEVDLRDHLEAGLIGDGRQCRRCPSMSFNDLGEQACDAVDLGDHI